MNISDTPFVTDVRINKRFVYNLITNAKISGKIRDINWLRKISKKIDINEEYLDSLEEIINNLNEIYNKNWDFHFEPVFDSDNKFLYYTIHIIIRFKELEITNSQELFHTIKESFFVIKLDRDCTICKTGFTRFLLSYNEYIKGYLHSHCSFCNIIYGNNIGSCKSLCFGVTTDISYLIDSLTCKFDKHKFEMFLLLIENYLKWESIEGVPYNYISDIIGNHGNIKYYPLSDIVKETYTNAIVNRMLENHNKYNFVFNNNRYRIVLDDIFERKVFDICKQILPESSFNSILVTKINGIYCKYNYPKIVNENDIELNNLRLSNGLKYGTQFRNERIEFKILDNKNEKIVPKEKYRIHNDILESVVNKLEKIINYNAIKSNIIKRENKTNNT